MPKKNDIQVQESEDELKKLMPKQKSNSNKNKVKMLLLLKQGKVTYIQGLIPFKHYIYSTSLHVYSTAKQLRH